MLGSKLLLLEADLVEPVSSEELLTENEEDFVGGEEEEFSDEDYDNELDEGSSSSEDLDEFVQ
jgi:Mrp family chromosome partitioning ATPase